MAPTSPPIYHTSLLTAIDARSHVHLIIGSNSLAATRVTQSLASGARPILISPASADSQPLHHILESHISSGTLIYHPRPVTENDILTLGRPEINGIVDAVFITSPDLAQSKRISDFCKRNRVPVNVVDAPALCTFSLLSTYTDGPLQIGVTTNGRGCKLASRIRREVAASLPTGMGEACGKWGEVRRRIQDEDKAATEKRKAVDSSVEVDEGVDDSVDQTAAFNKLVTETEAEDAKTRRIRWLSQVCEYWPLKKLVEVGKENIEAVLDAYHASSANSQQDQLIEQQSLPSKKGLLILAGSGPGHPDLLTRATHRAILSADLILADKLVPSGVLDLIPRRTPVSIARKFPGNADAAQEELLTSALAAFNEGKTVLRLKQGDPFLYGRGGEEVDFFKQRGLGHRVVVLPGLTSALSAPLFAGVPVTQRDVADQVLICTGTGKKGRPPTPPEWVGSRTVVFLMALHRIGGLVAELTGYTADEEERGKKERGLWPVDTPCAVVERASCPDQRVIRTTLRHVEEAIEAEGSRPPGLLVVGRACEALYTPDKDRNWVVEDGFAGLELDGVRDIGV
ncbi:hypothetical protein DL546_000430 [Coniochaeta pulveracea]|uniref:Precorrin-2 dehydrogenase n=1 Tax=Coniochaeta pulveracea TaxID=177199 RepID=A0A420Y5Q2_9PEZI|nr:hypothetical protein DL546_000430 [Coniochaeta pulveracea]